MKSARPDRLLNPKTGRCPNVAIDHGLPDLLMQMWTAYLAARQGARGGRFVRATPDEAGAQHKLWGVAL
jgi:hypothetical protein